VARLASDKRQKNQLVLAFPEEGRSDVITTPASRRPE
jgi:hypothetical protein